MPADPSTWLEQDETGLLTSSRMYWEEAARLGAVDDGAATKTVYLPRRNLFDVDSLRAIMKKIGDGGEG